MRFCTPPHRRTSICNSCAICSSDSISSLPTFVKGRIDVDQNWTMPSQIHKDKVDVLKIPPSVFSGRAMILKNQSPAVISAPDRGRRASRRPQPRTPRGPGRASGRSPAFLCPTCGCQVLARLGHLQLGSVATMSRTNSGIGRVPSARETGQVKVPSQSR